MNSLLVFTRFQLLFAALESKMMMVSTVFTILFGVAGPHRFSRTATPDSNAPCNVDSSTAEEQADYLNMSGPSATASSTLAGDYLAMTPRATLSSSPSARSIASRVGAARLNGHQSMVSLWSSSRTQSKPTHTSWNVFHYGGNPDQTPQSPVESISTNEAAPEDGKHCEHVSELANMVNCFW